MSSVRPYRYINILRSKRGMHDMGQDFMTTTDTQRGADVEGLVLTVEKLEALLRCAGTTTLEYIGRIESERRDAIARLEAAERERDAWREVVALMDIDGKRQAIRDDRVDSIVKSLCEQHGYGAVMDSAARQWRSKDPIGAFLVGPCVATAQAVVSTTNGAMPNE
jgi:hypothetical protein